MIIHDIRRKNIATLIDRAGGQKELAEMTGMNKGYVSQLMTSRKNPGGITLQKLEAVFGLEKGWLDIDHEKTKQEMNADVDLLFDLLGYLGQIERIERVKFTEKEKRHLIKVIYRHYKPQKSNVVDFESFKSIYAVAVGEW